MGDRKMKKLIGLLLAMTMMMVFIGGCAPKKEEVKVVDLKAVHEAVKESLGEDYYPNQEIPYEMIDSFTGIKEEDLESYIAEMPMISMSVDTFIAMKAKEGKGDDLEAGLEKYRKYLVEESMQYPMNMAKVNAAKVVRHGDYLFFIMLGKYDDRLDATEEEQIEFARLEIEKIEEVINKFFE